MGTRPGCSWLCVWSSDMVSGRNTRWLSVRDRDVEGGGHSGCGWRRRRSCMWDRPCSATAASHLPLCQLGFYSANFSSFYFSPSIRLKRKTCKWGRRVSPALSRHPCPLAHLGAGVSQVSGFLPDAVFHVFLITRWFTHHKSVVLWCFQSV